MAWAAPKTSYKGVSYSVGDFCYITSYDPMSPHFIGRILSIRRSSSKKPGRDTVTVFWLSRWMDLPMGLRTSVAPELPREYMLVWPRRVARETLRAERLRGKCYVTAVSAVRDLTAYLKKEHRFFYDRLYDESERRLYNLKHQAIVSFEYCPTLPEVLENQESPLREALVFSPNSLHDYTEQKQQHFLTRMRSLVAGRLAIDKRLSTKNPGWRLVLQRDYALEYGLRVLQHRAADEDEPDIEPDALVRWSKADRHRFIEAVVEYGKQFGFIQRHYFPKKTTKDLVEFYYLFKKTKEFMVYKKELLLRHGSNDAHVTTTDSDIDRHSISSSSADNPPPDPPKRCGHCGAKDLAPRHRTGLSLRPLCGYCRNHFKLHGHMPRAKFLSNTTHQRSSAASSRRYVDSAIQDYARMPELELDLITELKEGLAQLIDLGVKYEKLQARATTRDSDDNGDSDDDMGSSQQLAELEKQIDEQEQAVLTTTAACFELKRLTKLLLPFVDQQAASLAIVDSHGLHQELLWICQRHQAE
eukprot:TRINITY_DN10198_c0_g3_i2.p1 TRINITY_DN10198_c0_g3~~TRINITY_DN10198_c0_g3_i2.p1  ORF type:complete len:587 (+),score=81.84 TRINITY_DN10198_c0_g3_i2:179-1762(+)